MRRVTLTVFFCLAACGGSDVVDESEQDVIHDFARKSSPEALQACLKVWKGEQAQRSPGEGPVSKPDVSGLREFLAECLGVPSPGGARALPDQADARKTNTRVSDARSAAFRR